MKRLVLISALWTLSLIIVLSGHAQLLPDKNVIADTLTPSAPSQVYLPVVSKQQSFLFAYEIAPNVPITDANLATAGLIAVQDRLNTSYGGNVTETHLRNTQIKVLADGNGVPWPGAPFNLGCFVDEPTIGKYVVYLDVLHFCWQANTYAHRQHTAAHEFAHVWQKTLLRPSRRGQNEWLIWLMEGMAEVIGYDAAIPSGYESFDEVREERLLQARWRGVFTTTLQSQESGFPNAYELYFLAAERLTKISPRGNLAFKDYLVLLDDGATQDQAFQSAFGITRPDFYAQFPGYLNQLWGGEDVIYRNHFDFTASAFISSTFSWGKTGAANGRLFWSTENSPVNWAILAPVSQFSGSYSVEAVISWDIPHSGGHGLMFGGGSDASNHYLFLVNPDSRRFALLKRIAGGQQTLIDWSASNKINSSSPNKLRVEHRGSGIALYVNNEIVASTTDSSIPNGYKSGVANIVNQTTTSTTYYDDFFIRKLQ